jgi:hydrogenase maturation protease
MNVVKQILVAGIGNIFHGDDAFGVEVARRLLEQGLPEEAEVVDFGIRGYDLAYAMTEGYYAVVLVDATSRGQLPGTLYLLKPDLDGLGALQAEAVDAHSLTPDYTLQMAQSLGGRPERLYLVGCEPAVLETEDGRIGLSEPVEAAVLRAIEIIQSLVSDLLKGKRVEEPKEPGLVQAEEEGQTI